MQNTKFLYTIGYEVYTIQVQVKNIRHLYFAFNLRECIIGICRNI